jgi:hypothetical protein
MENLRAISAVPSEEETVARIWPSMCRHHVSNTAHYARGLKRCGGFFSPDARDIWSNTVNGRCALPWAPLDVQSCQCQAIPATGGVTTRRSNASSLMSLPASLFSFDQEEKPFQVFNISRYVSPEFSISLTVDVFLESLLSLRDPECKGYFSKCFAFYSRSLNRPLEVFSVWHLA